MSNTNTEMNEIRIDTLEIQQFGPFKKQKIEFQNCGNDNNAELHIFTGQNGTGKSSLLYALTGILNQAEIQSRIHPGERFDEIITITYSNKEKQIIGRGQNSNLTLRQQSKTITDEMNAQTSNYLVHPSNFAFFAYTGKRTITHHDIHKSGLRIESPITRAAQFKNPDRSLEFSKWIYEKDNERNRAFRMGNKEKYAKADAALTRISNALNAIMDEDVSFDIDGDPVEVKLKFSNRSLRFDTLPDGVKSILSWVGDLLMRLDRLKWKDDLPIGKRRIILFLDEIDIHLHPFWQKRVIKIIQKLFTNAQIFVSTHSPFVVGSIEHGLIYKLEQEKTGVKIRKPKIAKLGFSIDEILQDIFDIDYMYDVVTNEKIDELNKEIKRLDAGEEGDFEKIKNIFQYTMNKSEDLKAYMSFIYSDLKRRYPNDDF